jgi:hypothetical protein
MSTMMPSVNRSAITIAFGTLLYACNTSSGHGSVVASAQTKPASVASTATPHDVGSRKNAMTPLNQLLLIFAGRTTPWSAFDQTPGLQWRDAKPQANPGAVAPDLAYDRSGTLMLDGFNMVDVPDGEHGVEAGTKQDNEGHAGVTLSGSAEAVQSIAVFKFYPSNNYQDILQKQFDRSVSVRSMADACALDYGTTAPNTQNNAFYKITFGSTSLPLYAEAFIDDGAESHGPGSTTFVFYRSRPTYRVAAMHCKEH